MSRAVLIVLCLLALAGCTSGATMAGFEAELKNAGYGFQSVEHDRSIRNGALEISLTMSGKPTDDDWEKICKIAWVGYPDDFGELKLIVNGELGLSMTRRELFDAYGERP